jgi:predicted Zn-dependent protease
MLQSLLPSFVCVAILSGCAATSPDTMVGRPGASAGVALAEADAALKAGQSDKALAILKGASASFPADKAAWLRMAQLRFDSNNYGEAIVNALQALERDPDDMLAHSIVAVSGLRVSSKALADLTQKNNLSGTVRTEAQDLAKLLRTSLGEDVLVPVKSPPRVGPPKKGASTAASTAPKPTSCSDPFCSLK